MLRFTNLLSSAGSSAVVLASENLIIALQRKSNVKLGSFEKKTEASP